MGSAEELWRGRRAWNSMMIFLSGVSQLQMKSKRADTWFKGIKTRSGFLTERNEANCLRSGLTWHPREITRARASPIGEEVSVQCGSQHWGNSRPYNDWIGVGCLCS